MKTLLIKNASVWRWKEDSSHEGHVVENGSVFVENGYITKVLESAEEGDEARCDQVIDANGALLLPGLIDSHIHVGLLGESQFYIDCSTCKSVEDIVALFNQRLVDLEDLPSIVGFNWDQSVLGRYPTKNDLDKINTDKPVFIWRACWHIGVANSQGLHLAGLLDHLQRYNPLDTEGGQVDLDEQGLPNGILRERAVEPLVAALAQFKSPSQRRRFIEKGLGLCSRAGLTSVQTNDEQSVEIYEELCREKKLPLRVILTAPLTELGGLKGRRGRLTFSPSLPASSPESLFSLERIKIFSDGSLGAETAALRNEGGGYRGLLIHSSPSLTAHLQEVKREGYRVEVHAIGDQAAVQVLQGFRAAGLEKGDRPVLTHCQVLGWEIIEDMLDMGVIANVQPSFVPTDMRWVGNRLSPAQNSFAYIWRSLLERGVQVAGGSDAPIESPNPFTGMFDAMHRTNKHRVSAGEQVWVYNEKEKMTFSQALSVYTRGGAFAGGYEDLLGCIEEGYAGDLVLVSREVLTDSGALHGLLPRMVIVGGDIVHHEEGIDKDTALIRLSDKSALHGGAEERAREGCEGLPGKAGKYEVRRGYCGCFLLEQQYCFT